MAGRSRLNRETLGQIATMQMDAPWEKLAAAVLAQALDDACNPHMPEWKSCARLWLAKEESVFFSALTTATITVEDIKQMAAVVLERYDSQVRERAEAFVDEARAKE